jgi:hypothetical protein
MPRLLPAERWALTPPFHLCQFAVRSVLLLLTETVVSFLLHLLSNCRLQQFAFPLGSTVLYAVRTFLPAPDFHQAQNDKTAPITLSGTKL